jgi:hypothetical protein
VNGPPRLFDPDGPGAARADGPETMRAAAESLRGQLGRLQALVLEAVRAAGEAGMTDEELERALGLRHQSVSARRRELVLRGQLADSGDRRRTSSGRAAIVWRPT